MSGGRVPKEDQYMPTLMRRSMLWSAHHQIIEASLLHIAGPPRRVWPPCPSTRCFRSCRQPFSRATTPPDTARHLARQLRELPTPDVLTELLCRGCGHLQGPSLYRSRSELASDGGVLRLNVRDVSALEMRMQN